MSDKRIRLKGGTIVSMNSDFDVGTGDVVIDKDRIVHIGARSGFSKKVDEELDVRGMIVMPGIVQPHIHLCQTLFRGRADDLQLLDWLMQKIWPFEAAHTEESLYVSALLGSAELLRSGTTAILDMGTVRHTDAIFRAAKKAGIRATIGKAMMDLGDARPEGLSETTHASIEESIALAERWHGKAKGRLRYGFAPRFVLSCTEELLERTTKEAKERGMMLHTHASENMHELKLVEERTGKGNVEYLHSLGMAGPDTVYAHCVWLSDEEKQAMADSGTHVAHCPSSNLKLASGVAPIPELLEKGINVALGADGAPCNNNLDGFMEMRLAGLIHKPRFGPEAMPARSIVEMATRRGARALGLEEEIGSVEVGKKADLAVVATKDLHLVPNGDPYSVLAYAARGSDVVHVFVDGVQRVRDGKVLGIDRKKLLKSAAKWASALCSG